MSTPRRDTPSEIRAQANVIGYAAVPGSACELSASMLLRYAETVEALEKLESWLGEYPNDKYTGEHWLMEIRRLNLLPTQPAPTRKE